MRRTLREVGKIDLPGTRLTLRMSVGVAHRTVPPLPRGRVASRAHRRGTSVDAHGRDGARRGRRRDPDQRGDGELPSREMRRGSERTRMAPPPGASRASPTRPTRRPLRPRRSSVRSCLPSAVRDAHRRRRRHVGASPGHGGLHPLRRNRCGDRGPRRRCCRRGDRRARHAGSARPPTVRASASWHPTPTSTGEADPGGRRTAHHGRGRGAHASGGHGHRDRGAGVPGPDRGASRRRLRGRHRPVLSPHLHGDGRRREPRGSADGQGRARACLRDERCARPLEHPLRDRGDSSRSP